MMEGQTLPKAKYERVLAEDIQVGDRVARARTHGFLEVASVVVHAKSVVIRYANLNPADIRVAWRSGGMDRPQRHAKWWREV
jgi:hypothetical protein